MFDHSGRLKAYFAQGLQYHSDSKGELLFIPSVHPRHAGNAAVKLLREARFWAEQCGVASAFPELWMTQQPLFIALRTRAGAHS